jgi:alpha-glucosidase
MVAEAWVSPLDRLARYVRPGEFHQAFNFSFLLTPWHAAGLRNAITDSARANGAVGAPSTWVLSNHDVIRHATRLGFPDDRTSPWLEAGAGEPDPELGLRRARAATMLMLALPGSAYLYYGEELGLPEVIDLPAEARQDPAFRRTHGDVIGRDGCRVPMPWEAGKPAFGFGPGTGSGNSWLPQPPEYGELAVDRQNGQAGTTLELYRTLLSLRRARGLGAGAATLIDLGDDIVALDIVSGVGQTRVVVNLGTADWPIPADAHVLVSSDPDVAGHLPTDRAVWITGPSDIG